MLLFCRSLTPGYVKQGRPAGNDGTKKRREREKGREEWNEREAKRREKK